MILERNDTAPLQNPPSLRSTTVAAASSRGATKTYGTRDTEVLALDQVDIDFPAGQFTAIMGPSGSGKSTL
ncbi:MAG TPA: ATP-binding cassette domain-containing protein, partial [Ilumatobacteraceae bacterium]